jgi:Flp pilus assembly protein TadG
MGQAMRSPAGSSFRLLPPRQVPGPRRPRRVRDAGVAALELAMLMPMLALLLLGMFDYGKYMWVAVAATQAAREGARELSKMSVGTCSNTTAVNAAIATEQGSSGAAKLFMNQIGLSSATTVTASCVTTVNSASVPNPTWKVALQIDFPPLLGYMTRSNLMPKGTGTTARVKAAFYMRGY